MEPLISVIVPVYNVEAYLDRCVESIVRQTYERLEIILVDDGSTDASGTLCDAWKEKDSRIVVIHQQNGGQARARNTGLATASGSLIGFVDADDYIDQMMYASMQKTMQEYDCDIVECGMLRFEGRGDDCATRGSGNVIVMGRKDAIVDFIKDEHLHCTVPNMLVKAEIARRVLFDEGKTHEDILWPYRAYMLSDTIAYIDKAYYFYYQRPGSTMNTAYSAKRFDGLDALRDRALLIKTDYPDVYPMAVRSYLGSCMYQHQFLCRQQKSEAYEAFKKVLYDRFCAGDKCALYQGAAGKHRLWYFLFTRFPRFTSTLRNILKIGL